MTFAAVAVAVVGAGVAAWQASEQADAMGEAAMYSSEAGGRRQAQNEYEAKQIIEQSKEQARKVRAEAINVRGKQVAAQASAGVVIGDGSAQAMVDEVSRLSEADAVAYLLSGANGSISANEQGRLAKMDSLFQANQLVDQANTTRIGGYINAGTSVLGAGLKAYKNGAFSSSPSTSGAIGGGNSFGGDWATQGKFGFNQGRGWG